jgi:hypothetical protein
MALQVDQMQGKFSLINPNTFCNEVHINPTVVGERKDKSIADFITNKTSSRLVVESVELLGDHVGDFKICSDAPPYALEPNESHGIELSFTPTARGNRNARVSLKTSAGYATARVTGSGIDETIETRPLIVNFGSVRIGDSVAITVPGALQNAGESQVIIRQMMLVGPDSAQFGMLSTLLQQTIKRKETYPLSFFFKPITEGRTSTQVVLLSDAEDSPHIMQLYGRGTSHVVDPTMFREIVSPTALTIKGGSLAVGTIDVLGVLAFYGITDNIMIQVGGVIPVPVTDKTTLVYSAGLKVGLPLFDNFSLAAGYQYAKSVYDRNETSEVDSKVTISAPYIVATYGDDDAKASIATGYAFKRHVTISDPGGFDANALLIAVSGDMRLAARWKICAETYSFRSLGYVPITATARYLADKITLDFGLSFLGITTGDTKMPSIPVVPIIGAMWVW